MPTLTKQTIDRAGNGLEPVYTACDAGGDLFPNDGKTFYHVKNPTGGDITITTVTQKTVDGLAVDDRTEVVTAGEDRFIGPWISVYSDANGDVQLTYSAVGLTIAVLDLKVGSE